MLKEIYTKTNKYHLYTYHEIMVCGVNIILFARVRLYNHRGLSNTAGHYALEVIK